MSDLGTGGKVLCIPTQVIRESQAVLVRIHGTGEEARLLVHDLFFEADSENCGFFEGSVVQHDPYDVVRVDRPFFAKVKANADHLALSRTDRIKDLWKELEKTARVHGCILVQLTGQNRTHYSLSIEGNLFCRCQKRPLEEYLQQGFSRKGKLEKNFLMEGDTLVAEVHAASAATGVLHLDLVGPLLRLGSGKLDDQILRLFGWRSVGIHAGSAGFVNTLSPRLKTFEIDRSDFAVARREAVRVVLVDDDSSFATHLAWFLAEMGYEDVLVVPATATETLTSKITPQTVLIIDAEMEPVDGLSLILQLLPSFGDSACAPRYILMSANEPGSSLGNFAAATPDQALPESMNQCLLWRKFTGNIDVGLQELDDLILNYDERKVEGNHGLGLCNVSQDAPAEVRTRQVDLIERKSGDLQSVLDELKADVGAEHAALFAMDRSAWRVEFVAGEDFLKSRCEELSAQSYLPNSPIRDISYQKSRILIEEHVGTQIPRFRNLLKFFERRSLDDPVERAVFQSVAAIRLNLETAKKYSLFVFHSRSEQFHPPRVLSILNSAAERLELVILKDIHAKHNRIQQPLFLEGLARAGLRHDVGQQLSDIQMMAEILMAKAEGRRNLPSESLQAPEIVKDLREIEAVAGSAQTRIRDSLATFRSEPVVTDVELRRVIDNAIRIAQGVAGRLSGARVKVDIKHQYPDHNPLTATGDPNALQRILENVLVNAVEHGLAFGRGIVSIRVEVQRPSEGAFPFVILVHDNGPGIHGIDRQRIFEPLFSTKENGYGMGLAVGREIAEEYGLEVELLETAVLVGTTFAIRVPEQMASRRNQWS